MIPTSNFSQDQVEKILQMDLPFKVEDTIEDNVNISTENLKRLEPMRDILDEFKSNMRSGTRHGTKHKDRWLDW